MSAGAAPRYLAWRAHLRPVILPPDHLIVLSEDRQQLFAGDAYVQVTGLLNGRLSEEEIPQRLEGHGIPAVAGWLALAHLRALGLVREVEPPADPAAQGAPDAVWDALGEDPAAAAGRLAQTRVRLQAAGGTGLAVLERALRAAGVGLTEPARPGDLTVVVADDLLSAELETLNGQAIAAGAAWMTVKLAGTVAWIGPLFVPGQTACWACLAQRLRLQRQTEQVVAARLGRPVRPPLPNSAGSLEVAAHLAAREVVRWIVSPQQAGLAGTLVSLDLKTNTLERHTVVRRPQCPVCGVRPQSAASELERSPKAADGGRRESARTTLARFRHHVSPISGVVRALFELREQGYLHVAAAHAFPMYRYDFTVLRENLLGRSGGKGFDPEQARVSALCEALERYSGIWQPGEDEALRGVSRRTLGERAIDHDALLGFSRRQYAERAAWNASNDEPHAWVPTPFDDDLAIDWVPLRSLAGGPTRWAPAAYCYYGHPDLRHMFCAADSNGCAAGGTFSEAVAHGLLELIERDAAAIWWYNRLARAGVELDSFRLPLVDQLRALFGEQRREFWALDLTSDVGVPVMAAVSARVDGAVEDIIYGFGADLDPAAALSKALLEMNQSLFGVLPAGSGTASRYRTDRPATRRWFQSATRANQPYLLADPQQPPRRPDAFGSRAHPDWREDVLELVERLQAVGLESFVLDQTRPDIGLPVCRVVVPGLCHFWRRLGSRRLYEVPPRLGWRSAPTPEAELNAWCIYF